MKRTRNFFDIRFWSMWLCIGFASFRLVAQSSTTIKGKVVDRDSHQPVEFATVAVMDASTAKAITGGTTALDGTFAVTTTAQDFYIEVSFIGFQRQVINDFQITNGLVNLGTISLAGDSQQLEEIVVQGEKSQTEFRLDKRVFNVGADVSSAGASALDVLSSVPSVNVNIEGAVSLRGSTGVQILINGKPSVLASDESNSLGTLTGDMIESIEVITNPSAKYDAEGTSGIINIILKKEEREGTNGSISLNTGIPHNHSVGFSLNRRTEKFNLFTQMGVGYIERPNDVETINNNYETDTIISSKGYENKYEEYYNVSLGADYHINDQNVITLSGNYALELEDQPSKLHYTQEEGENQETVSEWKRTETTDAVNPKFQFDAQYKRDFKDQKEHSLLLSATGSFFGKDQHSRFLNTTISGADMDSRQKTATDYRESKYTFKVDYTKPLGETFIFESGSQYLLNEVGNDYSVENLEEEEWIIDENQTNNFDYNQNVLAIYSTLAFELEKWGLKAGLRVENTDLSTYLTNTDESNDRNYTNFFPTVHTSYKLLDNLSVQGGYSRRIYRPRLWDLNPFSNISNTYSIKRGNPNLLPEMTDSYEVGTVYNAGSLSLNTSVYHRYTTSVIESISTFQDNVNITAPQNIGTNHATGVELNTKYDPVNWFTVSGDFNYNYYSRKGELGDVVFDFRADQWMSKVQAKFKLPADIDVEITGNYQSKYQTVQSEISSIYYLDLGARKKILKGKGMINFSIRDVFASRVEQSLIEQSSYALYNRAQRGRFITFGFSFGFGKGEAMQYGGKGVH